MTTHLVIQRVGMQTSNSWEFNGEGARQYARLSAQGVLTYKSIKRARYSKRQVKKIIAKMNLGGK